jgi:hypothetical protein
VSDAEAKQRADYDLRWKVALGVELDARPFAKSTLQEFRAQLIVHEQAATIFRRSLELAKQRGRFRARNGERRRLTVALDTTNILGRGAVKDTYNLLADGIIHLARELATQAGQSVAAWSEAQGYGRYVGQTSLKGTAEIDWSDPEQPRRVLGEIVADADRLLEQARVARQALAAGSPAEVALLEASGLLRRLLIQDVERRADGPAIKDGVAKDRVPSVHDPEMRHGRKSASKRFDGHKAAVAVDVDEQLITAVAVLPGNAQDHEQALELVAASEASTGCAVAETLADGAYGAGETRQAFADAGRRLVAKVPAEQNGGRFTKGAFTLDLEAGTCDCPGGQQSRDFWPRPEGGGLFRFAAAVCAACPLRAQCVKGQGGRSVRVHPQEGLLQVARAEQAGPAGRELRTRRQVVEHRIARLVQLGIRQARYFGRTKTLFQLLMAAAVANLTLLANADIATGDSMVVAGAVYALLAVLLATWSHPDGPERPAPHLRCPAPRAAAAARLPAPSWPSTVKMASSRPGF